VAAEQCANIGQPHDGAVARACRREHVGELALHLARLPRVVVVDAGQQRDAVAQRGEPICERPCAVELIDRPLQSVDVFGELACELDAVAADVVERQRRADPRVRVVRKRHTGQHAIDAETPSVVDEVDAERLAVLLVESPADVGLPDPAGDALEVVVGEPEASPYRCGLREVEHLAGSDAAACEAEQLAGDAEERVGLDERAVGQPDPEPMRGMRALHDVAEPEVRVDQWRIRLDVRTHHQDVARFERGIVGEQAEQNLAEDVDLAGRAVAGVHLDGVVVIAQLPAVGTNGVRSDVGLQPAKQSVGILTATQEFVGLWLCGQTALQLTQVPAEGGQQWVVDVAVAGVVAAGDGTVLGGEPLPQVVAGMRQPEMEVVMGGEGVEQLDLGGRQPGVPEQGQAVRQVGR